LLLSAQTNTTPLAYFRGVLLTQDHSDHIDRTAHHGEKVVPSTAWARSPGTAGGRRQ
jgi:hypothetical protein